MVSAVGSERLITAGRDNDLAYPADITRVCLVPCQTVEHILVECANLRDIREKYFTVSSLADLFDRVDNHTVIGFIKETHFYHQL